MSDRPTQSLIPEEQPTAEPSAEKQTADPDVATTGGNAGLTLHDPLPASAGRYDLRTEIARGGMGIIYLATDTAFGREVAVKVLQQKYAPTSGTARRFHDEARITGQLQHPNIPAVHDLGTLPDGRPFLAMKLIKGDTLDELLKQRPDPTHDRGRFVAVFEQICQAVAYAHAHGVIHRDLKPSNVMVGNFGEVQVMDWGLAKVLGERPTEVTDPEETSGGTAIQSLRDSDDQFTQAGAVLGTPAYMPPEQALGAVHEIDARSDVFGLGGLLAAVLTGSPPFVGETAETTRLMAAKGKVAECFARLDGCGADPELVALCKRCLAPEKEDRPADAEKVAQAVAELRAAADERARRAELDRVRAEGEKAAADVRVAEQRRRFRLRLGLAGLTGLLLLAGGGFAWYSDRQAGAERDRRGRNAEAVAGLLDQCEEALRAGDAARATVTLEAARKRSAEGGADELAGRLEALAADLTLLRDLDDIDRFRWTLVGRKFPDGAAVAAQYRVALGRSSANPEAGTPEEAAARVSGSAVRGRIVAAWDRLLRQEKTAGVRASLRALDADEFRDAVRDAILAKQPRKVADLAGQSVALKQPPEFTAWLGEDTNIDLERRRQLLEAAVARRPADLGLLMTLGKIAWSHQEGSNQRLRWYQAAVAAAPTNPAPHYDLGNVLFDRKDLIGAEAAFREAIKLDPKYANAHTNLGIVLRDRGDLTGAEASYREAIKLDPKNVYAHTNLGNVLRAKKDLAGAEAAYREAIKLDPKYAMAHLALGNVLRAKKDLAGAEAAYREAIKLDPKYEMAHMGLGNVLWDRRDLTGAEAAYREAIKLDPQSANAHTNLGIVLRDRGDLTGAEAAYREAIRLDPNYADAHDGLGSVLLDRGDLIGAEAAFREAVRLNPKSANSLTNLGVVLHDRQDLIGAEAAYRAAIKLDPRSANAHNGLGWLLQSKGDLAGAVAEFQDALRLDPKHADALVNLPRAERMLAVLHRLPDVLAGKDKPASPAEACEFARLCAQPFQKRYAAAVRLFEQAFKADPKLAADLTAQHRYSAACYAARAARGDGVDPPADAAAQTALRQKALGWLRAHLAHWRKLATSSSIADRRLAAFWMAHWLQDSDLSGVRPGLARIGMSAAERDEWDALWADVKATLAEAQKPAPPPAVAPPPREVKRL